jgi:hypothetical protein
MLQLLLHKKPQDNIISQNYTITQNTINSSNNNKSNTHTTLFEFENIIIINTMQEYQEISYQQQEQGQSSLENQAQLQEGLDTNTHTSRYVPGGAENMAPVLRWVSTSGVHSTTLVNPFREI